ncbi:hypothetical protein VTO42DRAFT_287 [Malbranchea cinnamomea]
MPPTLHCVRHAQGYHNLTPANHVIHDPLLTPHGETQCKNLLANFPYHDDVDLVVASPLRRTLYTALLAFEKPIREKGLKVIALPDLQETSDVPCDLGSDLAALETEVREKDLPVDLSLVTEGWNDKSKGRYAPTTPAIAARAREARRWLKARPEKNIVVVSHGGYLHYFTEDWQDSTLYEGTGWANTEFRTYEFRDSVDDDDLFGNEVGGDNASIVETSDSRKRRGVSGEAPSRELQKQFFVQAITGWENQMLQNMQNLEHEAAQKKQTVDIVASGDKVQVEDESVPN